MRLLLAIVLFLLSNFVYSQKAGKTFNIYIIAKSSASSDEFNISIKKTKSKTKIIYSKKDSISNVLLGQDKEFDRISNLYFSSNYFDNPTSPDGKTFADQFQMLMQKYTFYTQDSLEFKNRKHKSYIKILDKFYVTDDAILLRKEELKNRVVLDGTMIQIILKFKDKIEKDFYVHSPENISHPQIFELLDKSLNLYRNQHPNSILD